MKHPIVPVFTGLLLAFAAAAVAVPATGRGPGKAPATGPTTAPAAPPAPLGVTIQRADDTTLAGSLVALKGGQVVVATRTHDGSEQREKVPLADVVEMRFGPPDARAVIAAATPPRSGAPANNPRGISAHYFNVAFWKGADPRSAGGKATVAGDPDVTKRLQGFEHELGEDAPDPKIGVDGFSTVLTGRIRTEAAGAYTFVGFSDDEHWVYVNGRLVSSDSGAHGFRDARSGADPTSVKPIDLAANTEYDLVYLHSEGIVDAAHTLRWILPGADEPVEIPPDRLKSLTGPPAPPADLRAAAVSEGEVTLAFKDQSTSELRFVVERSSDASFKTVQQASKIAINSDRFADTAVARGTTYFYRVRAENFEGSSASPVIQVNTPPLPPAPAGPVTPASTSAPAKAAGPVPVAMGPVRPGEDGFVSLFNGRDLTGWEGNKQFWTVEDGAIRGRHDGPGSFLIYKGAGGGGAEFGDFTLRFSAKLNVGNSGMQYRSEVVNPAAYNVVGYQLDLDAENRHTGLLWDQGDAAGGRQTMGARGQKVTYSAADEKVVEELGKGEKELAAVLKAQDWNHFEIVAQGSRITHKVNGEVMTEVIDDSPRKLERGVFAIQLNANAPTDVSVKDIRVKAAGAAATTQPAAPEAAHVPVAVAAAAPPAPVAHPAPPGGVLPLVRVSDPAEAAVGFVSLFDGKTLKGWRGRPNYWSVRDGALTGETVEGRDANVDTYLVWTGPEFKDFELRFKYKLTGGNSGVTFRATLLDPGSFRVGGYSADIDDTGQWTGVLTDEAGTLGGRGPIAQKGQKVTYAAEGGRRIERLGEAGDDPRAAINTDDWNDYVVTAEGNRITLSINGRLMVDVTDDHRQAAKSGVLAIQAKGVPMTVQYKDIRIRSLVPGQATTAPSPPVATPRPADAPWSFTLTGGDRLTGFPGKWGEKSLTLRTDAGTLGVPVRYLDEAWRAPADKVEQARALKAEEGLDDVAYVEAEGGQVRAVRGLTLGAEGDSLKFRYNDQDRRIALDRLVGVVFGTADRAAPATDLRQSFVLAGGDTVTGVWTAFSAGTIDLRTDWGATLKVPVTKVARVQTRNGRLVYLSDFTPDKVEQVPYFDRVIPFRVNKSLTNGPLRLADGEHARGIAVHARTVLQYHTDGKFQRLRTKVGFQQPEGRLGRAVVRVLGDGKPLFERPDFRGDEPPADLDLDVTGVKRLTLEVDFGEGQDVGDRVVWANPRLLRAMP